MSADRQGHGDGPRVLHVSQPVDAGVPAVVLGLAEHQASMGWDVHVAAPPGGTLAARNWRSAVSLHDWTATRSPGTTVPGEIARLRRLLAAVAPDVVHLHSSKAGLVGRLAMRGRRPTLFQPHAWSFESVTGGVALASRMWERAGARWAHAIACVSEEERDLGEAAGVVGAYRVIANGVDTDHFQPAPRRDARQRLGWDDVPTVVVVGRLSRQKGQDIIAAAWPAVRRDVPDARLVLVGEGPDRTALEATAGSPTGAGIELAGATTDPRAYYTAADVVAVPSRWEGMALVPLEAAASERAVVGSDVAGMAASIGPGGTVVPVADAAALAAALVLRLHDTGFADREGRAGRRHVVANHRAVDSWRAMTELTAEVVEVGNS